MDQVQYLSCDNWNQIAIWFLEWENHCSGVSNCQKRLKKKD